VALDSPDSKLNLVTTKLSSCREAKIAILMCTYNGASFLAEQLESFQRQTHTNWTVYVSDDGSKDETLKLLEASSVQWGGARLQVLEGPQQGFAANFLSLTCREHIKADFYAWSDQDDIWKPDKLEKALAWLNTVPKHIPALYCGRTELILESGETCGYSPEFIHPPHFTNALVQNIGGGNTMVFNQAARKLLQEAGDQLIVPSHDWWAYLLISGAGGAVHYAPAPSVLYRQHSRNVVGINDSWCSRLKRLRMLLQGRFGKWNTQNINALEAMHHCLSQEHKATLAQFKTARGEKFFLRILGLWRAGVYRQTLLGNIGLTLAILLKKI
jgi:glycosyltransferase involved in cell wall biosynthesis